MVRKRLIEEKKPKFSLPVWIWAFENISKGKKIITGDYIMLKKLYMFELKGNDIMNEEKAHLELQQMRDKGEIDFFCHVPTEFYYQFFIYLEKPEDLKKVKDVFVTHNLFFRVKELI